MTEQPFVMRSIQARHGERRSAARALVLASIALIAVSVRSGAETNADSLYATVAKLYQAGRYAEAVPYALQFLGEMERLFGPEHPNVATALSNLGSLYYAMGEYAKAEPAMLRAAQIYEKTFAPGHPFAITALANLGALLRLEGKYSEAEHALARALETGEKALGKDSPDITIVLNNLASLCQTVGEYERAEMLYTRALQIEEKAYGPDHPILATTLNNLATLSHDRGEYENAARLNRRALEIREKALGPGHPDIATSLCNLALVYAGEGEYAKAESLYERAITVLREALGTWHPSLTYPLQHLASIYEIMGDYAKAESLYRLALEIRIRALGENHADVALTLNDMGLLYQHAGDAATAAALYQRAAGIAERTRGSDHPLVAAILNNLASLYQDAGDYAKAEPLLLRSLAIGEKALGPDNPDVTTALSNLALGYQKTGNPAAAEPLLQRALGIWEKALGPDNPRVARSLFNLAMLNGIRQRFALALGYFRKGFAIEDKQIKNMFSIATEEQKLTFVRSLSGSYLACLSLIRSSLSRDPDAVRFGLELVLRRKGLVLDAQSRANEALRARLSDAARADWDRLSSLRGLLAQLLLNKPAAMSAQTYKERESALVRQIEELEGRLARESAPLASELEQRNVTAMGVADALPNDSALVEFAKIQCFDFTKDAWTPVVRYLAFTLKPSGEASLVDLGEAGAIEKDVHAALDAIEELTRFSARDRIRECQLSLERLYSTVWRPLEDSLKGARSVFLSPDGELNLVPFAALEDGTGRVVLERYVLGYLDSGRELMRIGARAPAGVGLLLVANPDYNMSQGAKGPAGDSKRSRDLAGSFGELPGTAREAEEISGIMKGVAGGMRRLEGPEAREEAVKEAKSPAVLHVATHGFFLAAQDVQPEGGAIKGGYENPLVRSGLALAGANNASKAEGGDDGILTSLETSGMDLWGTRLVVLSACETARGEVKTGEGVFGLRRAFSLAGAQSLLMSLWPVDDEATVEQMKEFYLQMGKKKPAEALRDAQLKTLKELRESDGLADPSRWAPFILQGPDVLGRRGR